MKLKDIKHIHFTGIKGAGMTTLALCAQDLGVKVSGSDTDEVFVTDPILKKRKITYKIGFSPKNIPTFRSAIRSKTLLIYTAAHSGPQNPEVIAAKKQEIKTLNFGQALGLFMQDKFGISICGVGGKTTTAAMLATILETANQKPSYIIGAGNVPSLGKPGCYQKNGKYFIAEADEYFSAPGYDDTPKFLYHTPSIIGATNISFDHPDVYLNFDDTKKTFLKFFNQLPKEGTLVACADNPETLKIAKQSEKKLVTYGFHPQADFHIKNFHVAHQKALFTLSHAGIEQEYTLIVPGKFNALNATCAISIATQIGIDQKTCTKALSSFSGTMRRFQTLGAKNGITIVDDYAHHPTEIQATLKATKDWFPDHRVIAIFQPHTYSRTKALFQQFASSFASADEAIFLPIYASAREKPDLTVSSQLLCEETAKFHPQAQFISNENKLIDHIKINTQKESVVITLGAGDIFLTAKKLLKNL